MTEENPGNLPADEGIIVPYQQLAPETLRAMIEEFVSRDGADWDQAGCSLADKVAQVYRQLKRNKVQIVFDFSSQTANLVPCEDGQPEQKKRSV